MTAFLIDLAVVGTVAFCAWRGYKNGLIRGIFGVVSLIVSILVANVAAEAYSNDAKAVVMPFAAGIVDSALSEVKESGSQQRPAASEHDIDDPDFGTVYTVLRQIGLPEAAAVQISRSSLELRDSGNGHLSFADVIADKLTSTFSYIAVFGIAFLLLSIIFAVVGNLIGFVFSLPGLKIVDIIAGAVLGLAKGVLIVYTLAFIIRYFGILAMGTLEKTTILKYLTVSNPLANILGL
ncbi:MAG: CvpA family protein [Oscillospiraceae bacterium]|nr:CvpA family protein [Oscillospiraceae bacterium]